MNTRRNLLASGGALLASAALPMRTGAQALDKPARMLIGFPPGGSIDLVARLVTSQMKGYAPSIIVDNKPGAGGRIGLETLKTSPADGSTFILTPSSMLTIYPHVFKSIAYDSVKDFEPVAPVCMITLGLAVGPKVPEAVKTLADLTAWLKANPKDATLGYAAAGSSQNFAAVLYARGAGMTITEVPYKGGGPAVQDLLGGQIAATVSVPSTLAPHHAAGKLRVLATTGKKRDAVLPNVPTFAESGFPDIVLEEWFGVLAPAKTPAALLDKLQASVTEAAKSKEVQEGLAKASLMSMPVMARAEFAALLKSDLDKWSAIVKSSGYKPED